MIFWHIFEVSAWTLKGGLKSSEIIDQLTTFFSHNFIKIVGPHFGFERLKDGFRAVEF